MNNRLFVIDGHGLCYRAYYAVSLLTNSKGQPTNAVLGFCNILRKLLKDLKPTHLAVCFDVSKKTQREEIYPQYKANRQSMPDEMRSQLPIIREIVKAYRIAIIELENYEADDVMATLAKRYSNENTEAIIVTEDKDMGQMVGGNIKVYSPRQEKYIESIDVVTKFGVNPNQIPDYIGLVGDASDNIPGVFGIGEVGAIKLLKEFENIEGIYKHIEQMKQSKLKEKLIAGKEACFLSKKLATLHDDLPLDIDFQGLLVQDPNQEALSLIFKELEFRRFVEDINQPNKTENSKVEELLRVIESSDHHNKKIHIVYDLKACLKDGIIEAQDCDTSAIFDIALADYCLSGGQGQYSIAESRVSHEAMVSLYKTMSQLIQQQGLEFLLKDIETPLALVLFYIEHNGVLIDREVLEHISELCQEKIIKIEEELYSIAEVKFNLNSPKQLSEILFDKLKLPVIKKTKTGKSTDEEVLHRLAQMHPLPAKILEYRQIAKLKSTYSDALPLLIHPKTKRIHTTFDQTGAQTGRLSSNNPNLQNIPIRTTLGRQIRKAFIAYNHDHLLLSADYSQIELRVLAHLSKDPALCKAFIDGEDIHRYTASLMFDLDLDRVDEEMRHAAKRVNFGIIYGISAFGLAKDLEIPQKQAQDFIDRYFLRYPKVRDFMDQEIQKARDQGFVTTMFNRRRYLPEIHNANLGIRQFAQRQAINTPVQGTAADMIKMAMVKVALKMKEENLTSTMVLTVHDELVFDVPKTEFKSMCFLVQTHMEQVLKLDVPLLVSLKWGPNWLEMDKT